MDGRWRGGALGILRHGDYRLLWLGQSILAAPTAATFSGGLVCVAAVLAIVALLPKLRRYHL